MSSASDTEVFYDAEDSSIERVARRSSGSAGKGSGKSPPAPRDPQEEIEELNSQTDNPSVISEENNKLLKDAEKKVLENEKRRRRVEEMRRRIQNEDEDGNDYPSLPGSQTSSMDGLFAILETRSNPSVTGDADSNSTVSLGTVGTILSGADGTCSREGHRSEPTREDARSLNDEEEEEEGGGGKGSRMPILSQEPDVVASAKAAERPSGVEPRFVAPVAPPRKKRKQKVPQPSKPTTLDVKTENTSTKEPQSVETNTPVLRTGLPSPASTIESLTKEFEHSLDLKSAIQGQYVVKPQDEENAKAQAFEFVLIDQAGNIIGEDGLSKQLNMMVRTKTDSGKKLTDLEILEQVMVLNLDTGESIPLSLAEERIPRCLNPLSLHIMRLTSEYVSNSSLEKDKESDDDGDDVKSKTTQIDSAEASGAKRKTRTQIKKLFNKTVEKTVNKIKSVADHTRHHEETIVESSEDEPTGDSRHSMKFKYSSSHKGPYEFDSLKLVQDLSGEHSGPVWTMKFSSCGKLLATAGQDHILRIWVLRDAHNYFNDMRTKYNAEAKVSPTPSQESLTSQKSAEGNDRTASANDQILTEDPDGKSPFMPKPFCMYYGHTADLLDVSWSKNYFILSSSMDKTVRLWHISRKECLCCFQHIDFVTAIAFHPRDDRYFLSGSLDGKLRLWNIPDKKVALWNELDGQTKLITAASFCQNGKFAVVGSYDGRCIFYNTEQLKYYTQIHVRSTRGKNAKGRKISGIEAMPGEDKILVTSNDSRIRLYDLRDLSLTCKYKGYANLSSQIRASFSHDGKYIISGSENQCVYTWQTNHDYSKFSSARRDRNDYWEGIKSHNAMVTVAIFAPNPSVIFSQMEKDKASCGGGEPNVASKSHQQGDHEGYVLVSADFTGGIKIFANKPRSKFAATM